MKSILAIFLLILLSSCGDFYAKYFIKGLKPVRSAMTYKDLAGLYSVDAVSVNKLGALVKYDFENAKLYLDNSGTMIADHFPVISWENDKFSVKPLDDTLRYTFNNYSKGGELFLNVISDKSHSEGKYFGIMELRIKEGHPYLIQVVSEEGPQALIFKR